MSLLVSCTEPSSGKIKQACGDGMETGKMFREGKPGRLSPCVFFREHSLETVTQGAYLVSIFRTCGWVSALLRVPDTLVSILGTGREKVEKTLGPGIQAVTPLGPSGLVL